MRITDLLTGDSYYRKRRIRFDEPLMPRELTFSCYKKYPFFCKDHARLWFVEALQKARSKWPVDLWAWVLMPDHVHLIVAPQKPGIDVGRFQGVIKEQVARWAISWLKQNSPEWLQKITVREGQRVRRRFWQPGGGYDRNISNAETLLTMIDYIHLNPVRRGLVPCAEVWKWSSAQFYAGDKSALIEMDRTLPFFVK